MPYSLLYVSKTLLDYPEGEAEVAAIVAVSAARNAASGITGALISTRSFFAQFLEGEQAAVEQLMQSINSDPRHMRLRIIRIADEPSRFTSWSMAYSGYASFVDRYVAPLFSVLPEADSQRLGLRLIGLMEEFARLPQV